MTPKRVLLLCVFASCGLVVEGLAQTPPSAPPLELASKPATFGTTNTVYVSLGEWKFTPAESSWTYSDTNGNQPTRFMTVAGTWLNAEAQLPSGAVLQSIELDYCNTNATEQIKLGFYLANNLNVISNTITMVNGNANTGCTSAFQDLSPFQVTVDNVLHRYPVYVFFGNNADSTTGLAGVIIGYKLQVSQPGSQTFNDVPPSDPGYAYIEALAASGITGGCGGGKFCPDNPVTRRQMAIFLAKALGLSFN